MRMTRESGQMADNARPSVRPACPSCHRLVVCDREDTLSVCPLCGAMLTGAPPEYYVSRDSEDGAIGQDPKAQVVAGSTHPVGGASLPAGWRLSPCPGCGEMLRYSRQQVRKRWRCPRCRQVVRVSKHAFDEEERAERQAQVMARQKAREAARALRREGVALGRHRTKCAARRALGFTRAALPVLLVLTVLVGWLTEWALDRLVLVAAGVVAAVTAVAVGILLCSLPWFMLSSQATQRTLAEHARQAEAEERARRHEAESRQRAAEDERRRRQREEEAQREAQAERERAEKERQRRLTDAGHSECWHALGWWDFEIAVLMAFEHAGKCKAMATPPTKDAGLDGILDLCGVPAGVQCKHLGSEEYVQAGEIRDFIGALHLHRMARGYFATTGRYGKAARALAEVAHATGIAVTLLSICDLTKMAGGLVLTLESIAAAKRLWNVPLEPPPGMRQGRQRRREYQQHSPRFRRRRRR